MRREEFCRMCSYRLKARNSSDSILLVCNNTDCGNYWINRGSEIIMILK